MDNVTNITVNDDSITAQKKENGKEENSQEDHTIIFDRNEVNKSIIVSKKLNKTRTNKLSQTQSKQLNKPQIVKLKKLQEKQLMWKNN